MSKVVIYDQAQLHTSVDFPAELPPSQAYVVTGMFVAWLAEHDFLAPSIVEQNRDLIDQVKAQQVTGPKLWEAMGGRLSSEMLTPQGNAFAAAYFDFERGDYLKDFEDSFCEALPTIYHVEDNWDNYDYLTASIDVRYEAWLRASGEPAAADQSIGKQEVPD